MPNNAITTVTLRSEDPAALTALRAAVAAPAAPAAPAALAASDDDGGTQPRRRGLLPWRRRPARARQAPAKGAQPPSVFSLESIAPTGMDPDAWDHERATLAWGCARPELSASVEHHGPDLLVYEVATPYSGPETALRTLSAAHRDVVVHAVTTCESEYASTAWYVRGQVLHAQEMELELSEEEWETWDGQWPLPPQWAFDVAAARRLAEVP